MSGLGARSISAVFWGAGGSALRILLQMASQIVLARVLGPNEYGVFAIGSIVIAFSNFFSDIGLAYGLIQKREVSERDVRFVFTWQILLGSLVTIAVACGAAPIAAFFGEPRAEDVVRAMALLCLINALAAPAGNLLKRELDFKTQQIAFLISYLLGYVVVGIPLALSGQGVWALVAAWTVQAIVNGLLLYRATLHAVRPLFWYEQARSQGLYGGTVLITNLLNWVISNIDRVVIGRLLPSQAIGLYATTFNLLYTPSASVMGVLQPVFFSASARLAEADADAAGNGSAESLSRGFTTLVAAICLYFLPACMCVAAVAPSFIGALYGPAWAAAAPLCRPLAMAMPFFLLWGMCTPLLWASGNAASEFRTQWPLALLWCVACWLLAKQGGAEAVAWGALGLFVARCAVILRMAIKLARLSALAIWRAARGGVAVSVLLALVAALADASGPHASPLLRLLAAVVAAGVAFVASLYFIPALVAPELGSLVRHILHKLPRSLATRLAFLGGRESFN